MSKILCIIKRIGLVYINNYIKLYDPLIKAGLNPWL